MNLFKKLSTVFKKSTSLSLTNIHGWRSGGISHSGVSVNESNVLSLSAVWACVNLLSGTIGSTPIFIYRSKKNGTRVRDKNHPLHRILHDRPNSEQTPVDFFEGLTTGIELQGDGYAQKIYGSKNQLVGLMPIRSDIVSVRRESNGRLSYNWSDNGRSYSVDQNDMLHIRGFGGDALGGLSTLSYGRHAFGLANTIDKAAGKTFANGMRPSGTLTYEEFLTEEQRDTIETLVIDKFVGAQNAGKPMVLEGGVKWNQLSINPEDAQMLQSRGFSIEEVCRFFGVPPFMIGHTEKNTSWGSGLEQQVLAFVKFSLRKRIRRIEQALMNQLLSPQDRAAGVIIEFSLEGLLRGDSSGRSNFYKAGLNDGWLTVNEVRGFENLPPVAGGDVPTRQMQNVPITENVRQVPVAAQASRKKEI